MHSNKQTCHWPGTDELMIAYHDTEWGMPLHEDNKLFEFLILESFQAGLSWKTILYKRKNFAKAFDGFNAKEIAKYDEAKVEELMNNEGIIRNRLKIKAAITNAQKFLEVQKEFGSFDKYIWQFSNYKAIDNKHTHQATVQATTPESDAMSKAMIKKGFKFVGSTICYAFMQATGMVNDHLTSCFRYKACKNQEAV